MDVASIIFSILGSICNYIIVNIFFAHFMNKKHVKPNTIIYIAVFIFYVGAYQLANFFNIVILNVIASIIINFFLAAILYEGILIKKAVFSFLFVSLFFASELLVVTIGIMVFRNTIINFATNQFNFIIANFLTKILMLAIIILIKKMFKNKYYSNQLGQLIAMGVYPGASFIILLVFFDLIENIQLPIDKQLNITLLLACWLIASVLLFFIYDQSMRSVELEAKLKIIEEMQIAREYLLEEQQKSNEEKNAIIHDFKNHLLNLLHISHDTAVVEYGNNLVSVYTRQLEDFSYKMNNKVFESILARLRQQCEQQGVALNLDIQYNDFAFLTNIDTSTLFSNIFDNAINACVLVSHENRHIHFTCKKNQGFIYIVIKNSVNHEIIIQNNRFMSTKRAYKQAGYGIGLIQDVVHKYNGDIDISFENHVFQVAFWLKLE